MEEIYSSETLVVAYYSTRWHKAVDRNTNIHRLVNLRSYIHLEYWGSTFLYKTDSHQPDYTALNTRRSRHESSPVVKIYRNSGRHIPEDSNIERFRLNPGDEHRTFHRNASDNVEISGHHIPEGSILYDSGYTLKMEAASSSKTLVTLY